MSRLNAIVETAFTFPPKVTEFAGIGNFVQTLRGDPVSDRDVALFPKWMEGEGVGFEVGSDFPVRPIQDGEEFQAGILPAEDSLFSAMFRA